MCRAIEVDGEAAGSIGLFLGSDVYRRSAELGYWLGEPFWGRGIMTAAVETMCREGFAAWDIVRIHAEEMCIRDRRESGRDAAVRQ